MTSSWRTTRSSRFYFVIGGILLAVGLWDLFFVLFRSEDVLLRCPQPCCCYWAALTSGTVLPSCGRKDPGSDPKVISGRKHESALDDGGNPRTVSGPSRILASPGFLSLSLSGSWWTRW
jgi:hypothetical protein